MVRMDETTKKILEIVTDIQENMPTKADIEVIRGAVHGVATQLDSLETKVSVNTTTIENLNDSLDGIRGYAKEIDALASRVKVIEKQLEIAA